MDAPEVMYQFCHYCSSHDSYIIMRSYMGFLRKNEGTEATGEGESEQQRESTFTGTAKVLHNCFTQRMSLRWCHSYC